MGVSGHVAWKGGALEPRWLSLALVNLVPEGSVSLALGLTVVRKVPAGADTVGTWRGLRVVAQGSGPSHHHLPVGSAPFTLPPRGTRAAGPQAGHEQAAPEPSTATSIPHPGQPFSRPWES